MLTYPRNTRHLRDSRTSDSWGPPNNPYDTSFTDFPYWMSLTRRVSRTGYAWLFLFPDEPHGVWWCTIRCESRINQVSGIRSCFRLNVACFPISERIARRVTMYEMVCESLFSGLVVLCFPIYERIARRVIMCEMTFLSLFTRNLMARMCSTRCICSIHHTSHGVWCYQLSPFICHMLCTFCSIHHASHGVWWYQFSPFHVACCVYFLVFFLCPTRRVGLHISVENAASRWMHEPLASL